jgi:hypothetical protein
MAIDYQWPILSAILDRVERLISSLIMKVDFETPRTLVVFKIGWRSVGFSRLKHGKLVH